MRSDSTTMSERTETGFGIPEFMIAALVLLIAASSLFALLNEVQQTASYQTEVQSVLNNTRLAIQTMGRIIRQAGNDPLHSGLGGITFISPTEMGVHSDLTGSAAPGNPDKGDPDGDILDSGESITIRYNGTTRSLEIVTVGGAVQIVAGSISGLSFQCFDSDGNPAVAGEEIRRVHVMVSGASLAKDPVTHRNFAVQMSSDFVIAT